MFPEPRPNMGNPILRYIEYIIVYTCNIRKYTSIYIKGFFSEEEEEEEEEEEAEGERERGAGMGRRGGQ